MEVVIEKMNHQAMGIAKINGKVVFIPKVIVGDIVDNSLANTSDTVATLEEQLELESKQDEK